MTTRGDFATLNRFKAKLRALPVTIAHDVAKRTAPAVTALATSAFTSGETVYGDARPRGVDGRPLSLRRTGEAGKAIHFVANGRIVRVILDSVVDTNRRKPSRYAKYLIGKYGILPMGRIPARWQARIAELVAQTDVTL